MRDVDAGQAEGTEEAHETSGNEQGPLEAHEARQGVEHGTQHGEEGADDPDLLERHAGEPPLSEEVAQDAQDRQGSDHQAGEEAPGAQTFGVPHRKRPLEKKSMTPLPITAQ